MPRRHYSRILVAQPTILGRNYNYAVTGAKMAGLKSQMQQVNDRGVAYVTILMGANDLCTRTVAGMTSVADFRSQFERAMAALSAGSPRARIYVVSIPDVYRLLVILKDNLLARVAWRTLDICQSLLQHPRSTDVSDVMRRMTVRQRNIDFNVQLAEVCAMYVHCRLEWSATFDFTDLIPPLTTVRTAVVEGGSLVSLEAADDVGVAGIEYRLNLDAFQRYMGPFVLTAGSNIRFRAVDVNGNIEAAQSLTA